MLNVQKKKGISLITLIITIIVIIILAVAIILAFTKNNPLKAAREAKIGSSVVALQDALDLYKMTAMAATTQLPTLLELSTADKITQLELEDKTGSKYLYNVLIPSNLGVNTDLGKNPKSRTKLKDIFVLDVNDYVVYVDDDGNLKPNKDADIAIDPIGPIYTENNLPVEYIPIYTIEQFNKISTGETNYEIKNLSGTSKGKFNMIPNATYVLMNDLDFTSVVNQVPIKGFQGTFEGNRYTVRNITMDATISTTSYTSVITGYEIYPPAGLFDRVTNGNVMNLTIDKMNLVGLGSLGALMGENTATTVTSCKVLNSTINSTSGSGAGLIGFVNNSPATITKAKVVSSTITGYSSSGGIVATSFGEVTINSSRVESVNVKRAGYVGYTSSNLTLNSCKAVNVTSYVGMVDVSDGNNIFTNCEVSNLKGKSSGVIYNSNGTFKAINCDVNNSILDNNGETAGVISVCNSTSEIDGCDVNATKIINASSSSNTAGIIAYSMYDAKITNSSFTNSTISGENTLGGILATTRGKSEIDNCNLENIQIPSEYIGTLGGIIGYSRGDSKITNSKIDGFKTIGKTFNAGGIIASIGYYDTTGNLQVENCNINNISFPKIKSNAGGICCDNFRGSTIFKNISLNGAELIGELPNEYPITGGGMIASCSNLSVTNCNLQKINIENFDGNTGGLASYSSSTVIDNVNVDELNISCNNSNNSSSASSGLIAIGGISYIKNCNVKNSNILNNNVAGIAVYPNFSNGSIIQNCNIENSKILSNSRYDSLAAGMLSIGENVQILDSNIKGCTISDQLSRNSSWAQATSAGIVGISENIIINNVNVTDSNIKTFIESVGGISAKSIDTSIENCNVKNSEIISCGTIAGGINGFITTRSSNSSKVLNCSVLNSKVISDMNLPIEDKIYYSATGGIVGNSNATSITNCNFSDSFVTVKQSNAGGISGFGYNIKNCIVSKSTISDLNTINKTIPTSNTGSFYIKGLGGIVGHGINHDSVNPIIENCKVIDSTLNGCDAVGGISGVASSNIVSCEVNGTKINGVGKGIGGIQGFGGILNSSTGAVKINSCSIKNSQLKGGTNVNYFLGYSSFYPTDTTVPVGSRLTDLITSTTYENVTTN